MKRGFTDKLYFANLIFAWGFMAVSILLTVFSSKFGIVDMTVISVGVPAVFGELSIHTGFIIWKAKAENMAKWNKDNIQM